jgi:GNAT superfamily N-acetyltransferase
VVVDERARGKGYAQQLLGEAVTFSADLGINRFPLTSRRAMKGRWLFIGSTAFRMRGKSGAYRNEKSIEVKNPFRK